MLKCLFIKQHIKSNVSKNILKQYHANWKNIVKVLFVESDFLQLKGALSQPRGKYRQTENQSKYYTAVNPISFTLFMKPNHVFAIIATTLHSLHLLGQTSHAISH